MVSYVLYFIHKVICLDVGVAIYNRRTLRETKNYLRNLGVNGNPDLNATDINRLLTCINCF